MKLKKGDNVILIAGKDKGKTGKIVRVLLSENRIVVDGLNIMKKHQKPRRNGDKGSTISMAMPIHASNAMILDPKKNKGTRVGKKKIGDKMVRIAKKSNQEI